MRIGVMLSSCCLLACEFASSHGQGPTLLGLRLEGAMRGAVREQLGPPIHVSAGAGVLLLNYCTADGMGQQAVIVADGVVVRVPAGIRRCRADEADALMGAPVEAVVAQLGSAESVQLGTTSATLVFPRAEVQVSQGFVVGIRRR